MTSKPARSLSLCASLRTFTSNPSTNPLLRSSVGNSGLNSVLTRGTVFDQPALVVDVPESNVVLPPPAVFVGTAALPPYKSQPCCSGNVFSEPSYSVTARDVAVTDRRATIVRQRFPRIASLQRPAL